MTLLIILNFQSKKYSEKYSAAHGPAAERAVSAALLKDQGRTAFRAFIFFRLHVLSENLLV